MPVPPAEERPLQRPDAEKVDAYADREHRKHAADRVQRHEAVRVMPHVVQNVLPQPPAHGVAVGVDQQYAEGGSRDRVDQFTVRNMKIPEKQEGTHAGQQGKERVGIHEEERDRTAQLRAEPCRGDDRHDGEQRRCKREPAPQPDAVEPRSRIKADICRDQIQHDEPRDIVHGHAVEGAEKNVKEAAQQKQKHMLLFVQMPDQDVQKRNEQEKHNKTRGKARCDLRDRYEAKDQAFQRDRLISSRPENAVDHNTVKHPLAKQLREFSRRDMRGTHKISCDQHKAVNPDFAPCAKQKQKQRPSGERIGIDRAVCGGQAGIDDKVVRNDQQHADDPV